MKATYKLFAIAASLVMLSSLSQATLVTNNFITNGGSITNPANWDLGVVPLTANNQIGVLSNITSTNVGSAGELNNKTLLLTNAIYSTPGNLTSTNVSMTLKGTSRVGLANGTLLTASAWNFYDTSSMNNGNFLVLTNTQISLYNNSVVTNARNVAIYKGSIITLADSSRFMITGKNLTYFLTADSTSYLNFTSTNSLFSEYVGTNVVGVAPIDQSANLLQMVTDGKIRINGQIAATNDFVTTYSTTAGTTIKALNLIPEPATAGLFGLAGAMVFLLRRQMKKKQTDEID